MKLTDALTDKLFAALYRWRRQRDYTLSALDSFGTVMRHVPFWCEMADRELGPGHQAELLDFLIRAVKADLQSGAAMDMIYTGKPQSRDWQAALTPFAGQYCIGTEKVSSEGKTVIAYPWNIKRLIHSVDGIIRYGFRSDWGRYSGAYYPELELLVVFNGLHHSFVASQLGQAGMYRADIYPLSGIFPHVYTDGVKWYDKNNPYYTPEVLDVRMAILYELARMKHSLTPPVTPEL